MPSLRFAIGPTTLVAPDGEIVSVSELQRDLILWYVILRDLSQIFKKFFLVTRENRMPQRPVVALACLQFMLFEEVTDTSPPDSENTPVAPDSQAGAILAIDKGVTDQSVPGRNNSNRRSEVVTKVTRNLTCKDERLSSPRALQSELLSVSLR